MKNTKIIVLGTLTVAFLAFVAIFFQQDSKKLSVKSDYVVDSSDMIDGQKLISNIKASALTDTEIAGLIQMREEEKLARDVYTTLGTVWGMPIFQNIASSEQTHTDAIKALLTKYSIEDPVHDDTIGVFTSQNIQTLYNELIAQGKLSRVAALTVGATIEDLDINDLNILKNKTDKADILIVYNNLQKGSRNHLRAFVKNINSSGNTYTPKYIDATEYNSIINSSQEKGFK